MMHGIYPAGMLANPRKRSTRLGLGLEKLDRNLYNPENCYDYIARCGVSMVRIQSGWARTEQEKGVYDFAWLDEIVENLLRRGLTPWLCLCYGNELYDPEANNKTGAIGIAPVHREESLAAWKRYVKACVLHYRDKITLYEVWNEPDGEWCWKTGVDGEEYGFFAMETAKAVREVFPEAQIAAGSVCGRDLKFLYKAMCAGMGGFIDAVTYHNYTFEVESGVEDFVSELRTMLDSFRPGIKIIQGETGAQSKYGERGALNSAEWDERRQAKFLLRRMVIDLMSGVEFSSYFSCADIYENLTGDETELSHDYYGWFGILKETDKKRGGAPIYEPKPSYFSLKSLCSVFSGGFKRINLPVSFKVFDSWQAGGRDIDPYFCSGGMVYHASFGREDGTSAFVYWKAENIITADFRGTVSLQCVGMNENVKLINLLDGSVWEIGESKIEKPYKGIMILKNIPIFDYPVMIMFGDFAETIPAEEHKNDC